MATSSGYIGDCVVFHSASLIAVCQGTAVACTPKPGHLVLFFVGLYEDASSRANYKTGCLRSESSIPGFLKNGARWQIRICICGRYINNS